MIHPFLAGRPSLVTTDEHPLSTDLGKLRTAHRISGAVLITFSGDRVGVTSSGDNPGWSGLMETLGDQILAAIDDGQFDPKEPS